MDMDFYLLFAPITVGPEFVTPNNTGGVRMKLPDDFTSF